MEKNSLGPENPGGQTEYKLLSEWVSSTDCPISLKDFSAVKAVLSNCFTLHPCTQNRGKEPFLFHDSPNNRHKIGILVQKSVVNIGALGGAICRLRGILGSAHFYLDSCVLLGHPRSLPICYEDSVSLTDCYLFNSDHTIMENSCRICKNRIIMELSQKWDYSTLVIGPPSAAYCIQNGLSWSPNKLNGGAKFLSGTRSWKDLLEFLPGIS